MPTADSRSVPDDTDTAPLTDVQLLWLTLFFAVHLSFYASALVTDHNRTLFPQGEIQQIKTLDYSQVPNGATTFFEGGPTIGVERDYPVLANVYHPLFTIVVGGVLQLFSIQAGFSLYTLAKLGVTVALFSQLKHCFRTSPHFLFAAFVLLCHFSQAVEIGSGQYHFLLNACNYSLLFAAVLGRHQVYLWVWCAVSLFVKPVGLLWLPLFVIRRQFLVPAVSVGLFAGLTAVYYWLSGDERHYVTNLLRQFTTSEVETGLPRYSLVGVLWYCGAGLPLTQIIKYACAAALLVVTYRVRDSLLIGLFIWVCYYLLLYRLVFEYQYTSLIPFFVFGVLTQAEFQTRFAKFCMVLACLPPPFALFKMLGLFPYVAGHWTREVSTVDPSRNLSDAGMFVLMCLKVLPVLVLLVYVVWRHEWLRSKEIEADL